jgi:hypothetical protein
MNTQTDDLKIDQSEAGRPGEAGQPGEPREAGQPSEAGGPGEDDRYDEQRAAYEAELSRITTADMVLQAAVSLLNIGAHRMGLVGGPDSQDAAQGGPERDLEQVRDAIDAVRGLLPVLERRAPQDVRPLRDALSQLQMAYTRELKSAGAAPPAAPGSEPRPPAPATEPAPPAVGPQPAGPPTGKSGAGPAESSGRLWVPGR